MLKKTSLTLIVFISLFLSTLADGANVPLVLLEINGKSNYAYLNYGDSVDLAVSIEAGDFEGQYADVWMSMTSPTGQYWFVKGAGWIKSEQPMAALVTPLYNIIQKSIFRKSDLPEGRYTFKLSIDNNYDGIVDNTFGDNIDLFIDNSPFLSFRNCRACHLHPESFPVKADYIPDRHHALVQTKGLECKDCHKVTGPADNLTVVKITDCRGCHEHAESFPVKPVHIPDRHHFLVQTINFECFDCHRLKDPQ